MDLSPRAVDRILRTMGAAFALAAVADVLGLYTLSKVIADGLLTSVYAGVVFYAALNVARPMVPALLGSRPLRALESVASNQALLERSLVRVLGWVAFLAWARVVVERFTVEEPLVGALTWLIRTPVKMGTVSVSLGDLLAFVAIVVVATAGARAIGLLLEQDALPRARVGRGLSHAIARSASYGVFFVGLMLALGAAGIDLSRVTILAGALGVGIGFGLQNIVNNFISGLILLYERPIQVGDTVEIGALTGEVKRIGIRSSTLRTFQGAEVIVPNANLIQEQVVNWTLSDRQRRMELLVGVAYGTPPARVIELLLEVARSVPDVNEEPAPLAIFKGFGDNALNFELRAWTRLDNHLQVQSDLAIAINDALQKNGIAIPFPQRDVRLIVDDKRKAI
jgi:small-conductance mechanosensitive channel